MSQGGDHFLSFNQKHGNFVHYLFYFHIKVNSQQQFLSSFTHPKLVPNQYECLCSAEHKGRYSEECGKQSTSGAQLTSIYFFPTMEVNGAPKLRGYKLSSKYLPFVFGRSKTSIQVWDYLRVSKWWQNFHFCVNYPFKVNLIEFSQNRKTDVHNRHAVYLEGKDSNGHL